MPRVSRNAAIAGGVVLMHVAAIWGLHSGLLRRAVEVVVPVELLSQVITPPKLETPPAPPPPPPPAPAPAPAPKQVAPPQPRTPPPAPRPVAAPSPIPVAPTAPTASAEPQPAPPPIGAPVAAAPAPAPAPVASPAPPRIELPSSDAAYLRNPKPPYPPMSRRLGEQGQVLLRVLIGADGSPKDAQVKNSSGYDRLDRVALETVRTQWRFVPGKRNGVPEDMWFDVPVNFALD